ncbi:hypothetical protein [Lactobacillus xylocopicola]|uniref:Uncharacterized protein n=1 Tax=Lactobacillus xylocopicola TaxID=2976676 RepID=A0ABN6SLR4_9LACO|nr:hypothetical protein [Lactobacillus xylocopicola]BDR61225.1 hypothetical protein KIM322_14860 [Lactobacillus xylocopicola]
MTSPIISEQFTTLVNTIIKNGTYPSNRELSLKEKAELVAQLKQLDLSSDDLTSALLITSALYQDKAAKETKVMNANFSWVFEIVQHELVSATRLHTLLLDLAREEHFSPQGINRINRYFTETSDFGNNDNFVTMSATDVIDSLRRAGTFRINPVNYEEHQPSRTPSARRTGADRKRYSDKVIKLKDY